MESQNNLMNPVQFTPEMDGLICQAYLNYKAGSIVGLCKKLGIDHHTMRKRADALGLPKIRQFVRSKNRWSMAEINLLRKNETLTAKQLAHIFEIHGYERSTTAIDNYRRVHMDWLMATHMDEFTHGYSTFQIRDLLGVNGKSVHNWILRGYMKATELPCGNRRVSRKELLHFMLDHPTRWKTTNLDLVWLVDLVNENMRMVEDKHESL